MITPDDLLKVLRSKCYGRGSQAEMARRLGISPQYLSDLVRGNEPISESIADKLGYQRVVMYQPKTP